MTMDRVGCFLGKFAPKVRASLEPVFYVGKNLQVNIMNSLSKCLSFWSLALTANTGIPCLGVSYFKRMFYNIYSKTSAKISSDRKIGLLFSLLEKDSAS